MLVRPVLATHPPAFNRLEPTASGSGAVSGSTGRWGICLPTVCECPWGKRCPLKSKG